MAVTLESLVLLPDELEIAREAVRRMAYHKWEAAGRPATDGQHYWNEAEREWIERFYVPPRMPTHVQLASRETRRPVPHYPTVESVNVGA